MTEEKDLGKRLMVLCHQMRRFLDQITRDYEITGVQSRVLHFVCEHSRTGPVYQKDIENEFHIRRSTATGILKLMEKNGMIGKESVPEDARLKRLKVTARGMEYAERMQQGILKMEEQLISGLTDEEVRLFCLLYTSSTWPWPASTRDTS